MDAYQVIFMFKKTCVGGNFFADRLSCLIGQNWVQTNHWQRDWNGSYWTKPNVIYPGAGNRYISPWDLSGREDSQIKSGLPVRRDKRLDVKQITSHVSCYPTVK